MFWTGVRSNGPSDVGCHDIVLTLPLQDERGEERRREGRPATRRQVDADWDDAAAADAADVSDAGDADAADAADASDADVGSGDNSDED